MKKKFTKEKLISLKITGLYIVLGCFWILISGFLLNAFIKDPGLHNRIEIFKGWIYVLVTAGILYWLIHRYMVKLRQAYESLKSAPYMFDALMVNSHDSIFFKDRQGRFLQISQASVQGLGIQNPQEAIGKTDFDFFPPEYAQKYQEEEALILKTGQPLINRIELHPHKQRWISTTKVPLYDKEGQIIGIAGINRDITERIKATKALEETEGKYRSLVEESLVGVYLIQDYQNQYVSPRFAEIFGYTQEEIISKITPLTLTVPEDRERVTDLIRQRIENKIKSAHYTFKGIRKDGKIIDVEALGTRTLYQGKPAIIGTLLDITERKKGEASLQLFRSLLDQSNDMIEIVDPNTGRFVDVNTTGYIEHGYSREEYLSLKVIDIDPLFDDSSFKKVIEAMQKSGTANIESVHRRKDGTTFPVEVNLKYVRLDRDYVVSVVRNITERKQMEERLRRSEAKYRDLANSLPEGVFETDLKPHITFFNPQAFSYFGITPEDFEKGIDALQLIVPQDRERIKTDISGVFKGEKTGGMEYTAIKKNGDTFPIMIHAKPIIQENKPIGVRGVVIDITSLRQTEKKLLQLSQAVEQSPASIVITDLQGNIEYVNPRFVKVTGYTREEVLGKNPRVLKSGEMSPDNYKILWNTITSGKEWQGEFHNKKKNGELYWEKAVISPIRNKGGTITHYLAVKEDITERKRIEQQITLLSNAIGSINECISITDKKNNILYVNEALLQTYGYERYELIGKNIGILGLAKDNKTLMGEILDSTLQGGWYGELINYKKDGTPFPISLSTSVIRNNQNNFVALVGVAMDITDRKQAEEKIQKQLEHITSLRTIDMAITGLVDLRIILNIVLEQLIHLLKADAADILLFNQNTLNLDFAISHGFRTDSLQHTHLPLGESFAGKAALERRIIYIPNIPKNMEAFSRSPRFTEEKFVTYYGVPLIAKEEVKGVLEIFHRKPFEPTAEWLEFLESFAGQASIAIDNGTLFDGLQKSNMELSLAYDTTIEGWSHALDLRDKETEGHTQRVTEMTLSLAKRLRIPEDDLVHIRRGALLHDIGKMGVPDGILLKPGSLTEEEWVVMKKHPVYAYDLLYPISYLRKSLDIPYCHHEKWDGTGYPRGLKGESIPFAARMFAVVDVWDALSSDRPYRKAWPKEKIREHIRAGSGSHFDPKVVDAFLEIGNLGEVPS